MSKAIGIRNYCIWTQTLLCKARQEGIAFWNSISKGFSHQTIQPIKRMLHPIGKQSTKYTSDQRKNQRTPRPMRNKSAETASNQRKISEDCVQSAKSWLLQGRQEQSFVYDIALLRFCTKLQVRPIFAKAWLCSTHDNMYMFPECMLKTSCMLNLGMLKNRYSRKLLCCMLTSFMLNCRYARQTVVQSNMTLYVKIRYAKKPVC